MNEAQSGEFTGKTCGGHSLNVTRIWTILAGPESEIWQEWGPHTANHHWCFEFKEKIEKGNDEDDEVDRGDIGEYIEADSSSKPEEYKIFEQENDSGSD